MDITVCIPDQLAARLGTSAADLERQALEALVLENFRAGRITITELSDILGFAVLDPIDGFLKAHGVYESCTVETVDRDVQTIARLGF